MMAYSGPRFLPGVKWLIIVNTGLFLLEKWPTLGAYIYAFGALQPSEVFLHGQVWRLATYMFLHANFIHLVFNMLALWMFSGEIEEMWGTRRFVIFYLVSGIGSGLFSLAGWYLPFIGDTPIVGASGAIFAVMVAFGHYFPDRQILLFFILPVPARIAAIVFFVILLPLGGSIAHATHLGGIAVGYLYLKVYPTIDGWLRRRGEMFRERERRSRAREYLARERYFAEVIDPILKKISERGMESLTRKERELLKKASRKDSERIKRGKVVPFDLFR